MMNEREEALRLAKEAIPEHAAHWTAKDPSYLMFSLDDLINLIRIVRYQAQGDPKGFVSIEAAAKICDELAELRERGAGLIHGPGSRLRQAARMIRELPDAPTLRGKKK